MDALTDPKSNERICLKIIQINISSGTSLLVQGLRACVTKEGGTGSIPGQGNKIPQAAQNKQTKNNKMPELSKIETMA